VERELVELAAKGDVAAFEALARLSSNRLFAIAQRILRDHHLAEEALQQTLVAIWDNLPRLRDPEKFEAWTYRLIVRASTAAARREPRRNIVSLLPSDRDPAARDDVRSVVDRDLIDRAFRRLSPDHRAVLVLRHFVGLSMAEIAGTLGVPLGTAASRLHYAAREMRAAIEADVWNPTGERSTA
jgi:RNA polymerase sigma-70 factor (ECF subfamily)